MVGARYDAIADFYEAGWSDSVDDPASVALLDLLGAVAGLRVLEVACGHGRITRELARHGADVVGVDISAALIRKAELAEDEQPLGIRYIHADAASQEWWDGAPFDRVVCNFGLSDIDDLDRTVAGIGRALRQTGCFVFSILHPCFAGGQNVSGAWPPTGRYYDEGWWSADGALSTLRQQVGANHRTLSTYVNILRRNDLWLDEVVEPMPSLEWTAQRADAARFPVFLAARCVRGPMR
jgi:ubiquinone/menaquinone biosynthesis C-methylase UbiE